MSLPPYNPDANCPKCQTKDISTRYYPEGARRISGTMSTGEHLARHCRTCSFNWDEGLAEAVELPSERSLSYEDVAILITNSANLFEAEGTDPCRVRVSRSLARSFALHSLDDQKARPIADKKRAKGITAKAILEGRYYGEG